MLVAKMPKIELHCHLDGSVRVETVADIAGQLVMSLSGKREFLWQWAACLAHRKAESSGLGARTCQG